MQIWIHNPIEEQWSHKRTADPTTITYTEAVEEDIRTEDEDVVDFMIDETIMIHEMHHALPAIDATKWVIM